METAWIQIFILTFAQCVAPVGKTVCQQQQFELQFFDQRECEYALQQMIAMRDEADYVIVDRERSRCSPSAAEVKTFDTLESINEANADRPNWRSPSGVDARRDAVNQDHDERLSELMPCDETNGVAPCKIGDIIVEGATGDTVEVWKRD